MDQMVGVIDIGSNTIRMVIYEIRETSFHPIDQYKVTARLSNHFNQDGSLSKKGIHILLETLTACRKRIDAYKNCDVRCLATAAIRMAKNQKDILQKIKDTVGFTVEVIDGETEAFYGYVSVSESLPYNHGLTIDIGGASTEITLFRDRKLMRAESIPIGAVTLQKKYAKGVTIPTAKRKQLRQFLKKEIEQLAWLNDVGGPIVGLGGNARQLAQLLTSYKSKITLGTHGVELKFPSVHRLRSSIAKLNKDEILNIDSLKRNRADLIQLVLEVYCAVGDWAGVDHFSVSTRGIREGVLYDMLRSDEPISETDHPLSTAELVQQRGTERILDRYQVDKTIAEKRVKTVKNTLRSLEQADLVSYGRRKQFLAEQAASLFYIGQSISKSKRHHTTFSRLMDVTFDGYTQKDKLLIVLMASFKNEKTFKKQVQLYNELLSKKERQYALTVGALIVFCNTLIRGDQRVCSIDITQRKSADIAMQIDLEEHVSNIMTDSEKEKKHIEKALQHPVELIFQ